MTPSGDELAYWRTLAEARQRELEKLRALLLTAVDTIADEHVRALVTALDASRPAWIQELESMTSPGIEQAEVLDVLDLLWRQVAAERRR